MTYDKTLGAVRERERERELYFTKINRVLFYNFTNINVMMNNINIINSITMSVSKIDTG